MIDLYSTSNLYVLINFKLMIILLRLIL